MFSIGFAVYALSIFFHSGEDDLIDWLFEITGVIGAGLMVLSVIIFAWKFMP